MDKEKRKVTLGTTYYNNPEHLVRFVENHLQHVDELIIVDDASPDPAIDHLPKDPKIKLYRVTQDYGFNSHGCRNLIMKESSNDWVILLDVDRQFPHSDHDIEYLKNRPLREDTLYRFMANTVWNLEHGAHDSVNDFMIHRSHFFSAGGYDEELIGVRDGDRQYFEQLKHFGNEELLPQIHMYLMRKPSKGKKERSPNDKKGSARLYQKIKRRMRKPDPNKPILTFEWTQLL